MRKRKSDQNLKSHHKNGRKERISELNYMKLFLEFSNLLKMQNYSSKIGSILNFKKDFFNLKRKKSTSIFVIQ